MNNIEKYDKIGALCSDDWCGVEDDFIERVKDILDERRLIDKRGSSK